MKTTLPQSIKTAQEAKVFLTNLYNNSESYHPEDSAMQFVGEEGITPEDGEQLDKLMEDIYNLPGNDGRHVRLAFDPCEWLLNMEYKVGEKVKISEPDSTNEDMILTIIEVNYDAKTCVVKDEETGKQFPTMIEAVEFF